MVGHENPGKCDDIAGVAKAGSPIAGSDISIFSLFLAPFPTIIRMIARVDMRHLSM